MVPLDGSKNSIQGLEMAISIAMQFGATITGTYSISAQPHSEFQGVDSIKKDFGKEIKKTMGKAKVLSTQNDIEIKEKIMRGDTRYNIIKLAHDKK
ncbi:MAG: universal stress protein [Nitrosarchaeum sp.]|nr:universal stress protein [Nitrosarchaeum sp.]